MPKPEDPSTLAVPPRGARVALARDPRGFLTLPGVTVEAGDLPHRVEAPSFDVWPTWAEVVERTVVGDVALSAEEARAHPGVSPLARAALDAWSGTAEPAGVHRIARGVRVVPVRTPTLPPATQTNTWVLGEETLSIVDPASPWPDEQARLLRALEALGRAGRPVARILLSHHHLDHVSGAAALAQALGVPVCAHGKTQERVQVEVDVTLEDGEEIGQGDDTLRCVFTPGHAPGHLCFQRGDVVAAGDMVAGVGTILVDPDEGDMLEYLASLERLRALAPALLLPAHGPPILRADDKLTEYRAHRLMREGRVVAALAAARTLEALVPLAYADTPPALWPLAARSLRAHLDKLVKDGRVRHDGDDWVLL